MKKTRFLALALVVAVALMGAGYAYWAETVVIHNEIRTGNFDIAFETISGNYSSDYDNLNAPSGGSPADWVGNGLGGEPQVTVAPNGNRINFNFTNIYPGAGFWVKFRIKNNSSIPAEITGVTESNVTDVKGLGDKLVYKLTSIEVYDKDGVWQRDILNTETTYNSVTAFATGLNALLNTQELLPGEYIEINGTNTGYDIHLPLGTAVDNSTQNNTLKFDLEVTATQWNAQ